jgi:hypothetical protein
MNIGLRYEYNSAITDIGGQSTSISPNRICPGGAEQRAH